MSRGSRQSDIVVQWADVKVLKHQAADDAPVAQKCLGLSV